MSDHDVVIDALLAALSGYDAEAVEKLVHPEVRHWVNITEQEQGAPALLALLRAERRVVTDARFAVRHRTATEDGAAIQLVVDGVTRGGRHFHIPVCLLVAVADGRVTRIDEYASTHHVEALVDELTRAEASG